MGRLDRLKEMIKGAGKEVAVTAATVVSGMVLGPLGAAAVGGFLSRVMDDVGVQADKEDIAKEIEKEAGDEPAGVTKLTEPQTLSRIAEAISAKTGQQTDQVMAGLQYGFRELQMSMGTIMQEMHENRDLVGEVLKIAGESDQKIDELLTSADQTHEALDEVLRRLETMERGLDITYRKFIGKYSRPESLDFDRLMVISKLQRQRTVIASGFGMRYNPDLYVPRYHEEAAFTRFTADAGLSDRNIFLVLGNAGLGKTWFMAKMSLRTLEMGSPSFFVPLNHGIKSLTSVFQVETIPALVDLIDPILDEAREHAFIFLDGLDETDPTSVRYLLAALSSARSNSVSFVISCRAADWSSNRAIVRGSTDLKFYIYDNKNAETAARSMRINTPVSVLMQEFTDKEMRTAMERYGIPPEVPEDLLPLLKKPYILRLAAHWYQVVGSLPSPSSPEFLDLFAGGKEYTDSVFRRLGILHERDSLFATVEKIIEAKQDSLSLQEVPIDPESSIFRTLISSGMLRITLGRIGTTISLNPEFLIPLFSLTLLRYQKKPERMQNLLSVLKEWMPDKAPVIDRIVMRICFPEDTGLGPSDPSTSTTQPTKTADAGVTAPPKPRTEPRPSVERKFGYIPKPDSTESKSEDSRPVVPGIDMSAGVRTEDVSVTADNLDQVAGILASMMQDEDVLVQRAASVGLGLVASKIGGSRGMDLLKPHLEVPDIDARSGILLGMTLVSSTYDSEEEGIKLFEPLVEDWEWVVRHRAAFAISLLSPRCGDFDRCMKRVLPLLRDEDGQTRMGAVIGLGLGSMGLEDPSVVISHISPLLKDSHGDVRNGASMALGFIGTLLDDDSQAFTLIKSLPFEGYGKQKVGSMLGTSLIAAQRGFGEVIPNEYAQILDDMMPDVRSAAAIGMGLASMGVYEKDQYDNIIKMLNSLLVKEQEADVLSAASLGLSYVASRLPRDDMIQLLRTLISQTSEHVRSCGAIGYGIAATRFSDPMEKVEFLKPLLKDKERSVRKGTILGMSLAATKMKSIPEKVALISEYANSEDPMLRRAAALGLGVMQCEVDELMGMVLGEAYQGSTPLQRDESIVAGLASGLVLRYGH